jgi:hypothetical protein
MKPINIKTLEIQKHVNIRITDIIIFYMQYDGVIIGTNSNNTIYLEGNASVFFQSGDKVLLPYNDYDNEGEISSVSYDVSSDTTEIIINGITISENDISGVIALMYDVSQKLLKDGIGNTEQKIESDTIFNFDSGNMVLSFDNSDGYFYNSNETGLFNGFNSIVWVKYFIYLHGSNDVITNYMSGIIRDMTDIIPNPFDRTVSIRVYGHSKELERYPAFNVCDEDSKDMPKISGIFIERYIPSHTSDIGVKSLKYIPFSNAKGLNNIKVESVSRHTKSGIKILQYKYPFNFRWDNGDWVTIATVSDTDNNSGKKRLYDKTGINYANIEFGDEQGLHEFGSYSSELWVNVKDNETLNVTNAVENQGEPSIIYDNGQLTRISMYFSEVIKQESTIYSDISDITNKSKSDDFSTVTILSGNADEIFLISEAPFYGFSVDILEAFSFSDISIYHSTGGETYSLSPMDSITNGLEDNTSGFTILGQNSIIWENVSGWLENIFSVNGVQYRGYVIKLFRNSASGNLSIGSIKKLLRVKGAENDFIEFLFEQSLLSKKEIEDEIIIKYNRHGEKNASRWFSNIPINILLDKVFEVSNYKSNKITLSNVKEVSGIRSFNIWGKPPKVNYIKNPNSLYVDYASEFVYITVGLELWRCHFSGKWEFLVEFSPYTGSAYSYSVNKVYKGGNKIYTVINHENIKTIYTSLLVYSYDLTNGNVELENFNSLITTNILKTEKSVRIGEMLTHSEPTFDIYFSGIGQINYANVHTGGVQYAPNLIYMNEVYGENIAIAFPQLVHSGLFDYTMQVAFPNAIHSQAFIQSSGLDNNITISLLDSVAWIFHRDLAVQSGVNSGMIGEVYNASSGYYGIHIGSPVNVAAPCGIRNVFPPKFSFSHTFGQKGIYEVINGNLCSFRMKTTSGTVSYLLHDLITGQNYRIGYNNPSTVPICGTIDESTGKLYFGHTSYYDLGEDERARSYITECTINGNRTINSEKVFIYDGGYHDLTFEANNDLSLSAVPLNQANNIVYIGLNKKFRSVNYIKTGNGNYGIQYWNGSNWIGTNYGVDQSIPDEFISFDIPDDWEKVSVNGSADFYYIRLVKVSGNDVLQTIGISEFVLWDSGTHNPNISRLPVNIIYADGCIHGCMFDKDNQTFSPFNWVYFVYDLSSELYIDNVIAGEGYTYDGSFLFSNFVYAKNENKVYFSAENYRHDEKVTQVLQAEYNSSTSEITINIIGTPSSNDNKMILMSCNDDGDLFGITGDTEFLLWEYSRSYYPRIQLARFGESESVRNVLKHINEMLNMTYMIHSERHFRMMKRGEYNGNSMLVWDKNISYNSKPEISYWSHYYDAISVQYTNPITGETGTKKVGFDGWLKSKLEVQNPLIQNKFTSEMLATRLYTFFNKYRIHISGLSILPLFHVECMDRVSAVMFPEIDIPDNKEYIIVSVSLNSNKTLTIHCLEV